MRRRSQLYVPANNPRMIEKAAALPADSLIFDLEDAVPPEQKAEARTILRQGLEGKTWGSRELCVRINALGTPEAPQDLEAFGGDERITAFVVPKAEADLSVLARDTGKRLIPIVETARGLTWVERIVRSEGVAAVTYGPGDLAVSLGADIRTIEENIYVRTRIVSVAAAYEVDAIDKVFFDLADETAFRAESLAARRLGYLGKQVVHPSQVTLANEIFSPDPRELALAKEITAAYEAAAGAGKGAIRVGDRLVDAVHYRWARKILERAGP